MLRGSGMTSKRELFLEKASALNQQEKVYLLNVFKKHDIGYSKNTNGYFFNLTHLDDETLDKLENYIDLIVSNRKKIEENDNKRQEQMIYYKNLLKNEEIKKEKEEKELYNQLLKVISNKISVEISKKKRYKQKIINFDTSDEPTSWLIKKKYKKNTIYGRLYNKIKKIRSSNEKKEAEEDIDDNISEMDGEIDTEAILDNEPEPELDHDPDLDEIEPDHDIEQDLDHDLDITEDIDTEEQEQEHDQDTETQGDHFDEKLKFFKNILSSEGFIFSETIIKLQIEDYI